MSPGRQNYPRLRTSDIKGSINFMFHIRKNKAFEISSRHDIMPQACSKKGIVEYSLVLHPVYQEKGVYLKYFNHGTYLEYK